MFSEVVRTKGDFSINIFCLYQKPRQQQQLEQLRRQQKQPWVTFLNSINAFVPIEHLPYIIVLLFYDKRHHLM